MSPIARRSYQPGAISLVPSLSGAIVALLGAALLILWRADAVAWMRLRPEMSVLPAKLAVGLLLCGAGLLALQRNLRVVPQVLGSILLVYSLLLVGQYLFGVGEKLDALLFGQPPQPITPPESLAVTMSASLALAALALLVVRYHSFTAALLGSTLLVIGAVTCFGYAIELPRAFGWDARTRLPTVVGLGLLLQGGGMVVHALLADWKAGRPSGWWKSAMVGATAAVAGVLVWQGLRARETTHVDSLVLATAQGVRGEMEGRLRFIADALTRLGKHGQKVGWLSRQDWQTDARLVFGEIRGFETIEWFDVDFVSRVLASVQENPRPLASTAEADTLRLQGLRAVRETGQPVFIGPFPFEDGGTAFRVLVPLVSGKIYAYMSGVFSTEGAFAALAENVAPGYSLEVLCQGREVFRNGPGRDARDVPLVKKLLVDLPGGVPWWISVAPSPVLAGTLRTPLPEVALGASLLLAFLLTLAVRIGEMAALRAEYFEAAVRDRTAELEQSMSALRSEITERRRSEDALRRTQTISRQMSAQLDLRRLVQAVTDAACDLTSAACAAFIAAEAALDGSGPLENTLSPTTGGNEDCLLLQLKDSDLLAATLRRQEIVRRADVRRDPRYLPPAEPSAESVVSYLAAPVVSRSGEVWGALLVGHPRPGVFTQREEEIVTALAAQAAIAMDNARLYASERAAGAESKAASEAKDIYIHMLGHELRNPLGSISNALEVMSLRADDHPTQQRMRSILERQVARLGRIIDDLLEVSRIAGGKLTLRLERCDLVRLLREASEAARPRVESAGLRFACRFPPDGIWADVDPLRFAQIFDNLVTNSLNFTDRGGSIDVELESHPVEGFAQLTVRDSGCGIPADQLGRVFEPFVQTQQAQHRSTGGLGLGLPIVKGLMEAHGGAVTLTSAGEGHGTSVTLRFPLQQAATPALVVNARVALPLARQRVLVIDDHRDSADALRELLELYGHAVEVAYDGASGIAAARARQPDVVICDIGLPGMDGYAVAHELRRDPQTASVRLLALTGYGDNGTTQQVVAAGFESHLTKPVDPAVLRQLLVPRSENGLPDPGSSQSREHRA